jgi:hypothetical protein
MEYHEIFKNKNCTPCNGPGRRNEGPCEAELIPIIPVASAGGPNSGNASGLGRYPTRARSPT